MVIMSILKGEHCIISGGILYRCIDKGVYKVVDKADDQSLVTLDSTKSFDDAKVVDPIKWSMQYKETRYIKNR